MNRVVITLALILACCLNSHAQDPAPRLVEIYWHQAKALPLAGVTNVVILDDSICRAEVSDGRAQFFGLARGETVGFAWVDDQRISLRIRVISKPVEEPRPGLISTGADSDGNGLFGSSIQTFLDPAGHPTHMLLHHFDWRQQTPSGRLSITGQAQNNTTAGAPLLNLNSTSITYEGARTKFSLMDFPLEVNGGSEARITPFSPHNVYTLRGADIAFQTRPGRLEIFGGATIPSYFRNFSGTRDVAGFNFGRHQGSKLYMYTTGGIVSAPLSVSATTDRRDRSFFQTGGLSLKPNAQWGLEAAGGMSSRGGLAQGSVSFSDGRITAFASGTESSPDFPLNQLQLFFLGGSSASAGVTMRVNDRITGSVNFQHSATRSTSLLPLRGASDYYSSNLSFSVSARHSITLNYANTDNRQTQSIGDNHTEKIDVALNSHLGKQVSNTVQLTTNRIADPTQINSQREYTVREALILPIPTGSLTLGMQRTRRDPSLTKRLNDSIDLLPLALQDWFRQNPTATVQPADLPLELVSALESQRPADTEAMLSAQFRIGRGLNVSPHAMYSWNTGSSHVSRSTSFGYSLTYQVTRSLQLVSSISKSLAFDAQTRGVRPTTVMTVGFNKRFSASGGSFLPSHSRRGTIRGRLFVDLNLNGVFNSGEPGISGLTVELGNGRTAVTDADGRFEFSGLRSETYQVHVPLSQFKERVRLTGSAEILTRVSGENTADVNFGIVNFARVMGNVYNDYAMEGRRQPDASGVPHVRLLLEGNGDRRELLSDGAGDYGVFDIAPGDYALSIDRTTLPANFAGPDVPVAIHVAPVSTVVFDVPVRAIRSISGVVLFKPVPSINQAGVVVNDDMQPMPISGVRLTAGGMTVATGADGTFMFRDLPAGEVTLSVIPKAELPPGMNAPSGKIKMPREPIAVENVSILVSNPDLLPLLK